MNASELNLFPTRLMPFVFPAASPLNDELFQLVATVSACTPDSLNLLSLANGVPAIVRGRVLVLDG